MREPEFYALLERFEKGLCTPEEKQKLENWLESRYKQHVPFKSTEDETRIKEALRTIIYQQAGISEKSNVIPINRPWRWIAAAASIALIAVASFAVYTYMQPSETLSAERSRSIKPGGDKAILTLADGSQVELNTIQTPIPQQGVAQITSGNGQLSYTINSPLTGGDPAYAGEGAINTISTPRGGQYQVTLSDGSKIWLNAASSLKFPAAFSGNERVVELTGEAYFEIAKNEKMPFKVFTPDGSEVRVLGTHFNVMAYADEGVTKTTLLEGSVQVTASAPSLKERAGVRLVPGQQSILNNATGTLTIEPADLTEAMAWKNGMFRFKQASIVNIMKQVTRWYDIDVEYESDMADLEFGIAVSRNQEASSLLRTLEKTGEVHFEINGKLVIVKRGPKPDTKK